MNNVQLEAAVNILLREMISSSIMATLKKRHIHDCICKLSQIFGQVYKKYSQFIRTGFTMDDSKTFPRQFLYRVAIKTFERFFEVTFPIIFVPYLHSLIEYTELEYINPCSKEVAQASAKLAKLKIVTKKWCYRCSFVPGQVSIAFFDENTYSFE